MPGATVDLSGNNSKLNAALDQSRRKGVEMGTATGTAIEGAFTKGEIALGKYLAKMALIRKAVEGVASAALSFANRQAAVSEKYGGSRFEAELAGNKANIGGEAAYNFLQGDGAASSADRLGLLNSLGNDPSFQFSPRTPQRDALFGEVQGLFRTGLISQEEAINALKSGDASYIKGLVQKRRAGLSPESRGELATRSAVQAEARESGGGIAAGNVERVITAAGEKRQRENPLAYAVADAAGFGQAAEAGSRTLGAPEALTEMQKALRQNTEAMAREAAAQKRPNYTASDGK